MWQPAGCSCASTACCCVWAGQSACAAAAAAACGLQTRLHCQGNRHPAGRNTRSDTQRHGHGRVRAMGRVGRVPAPHVGIPTPATPQADAATYRRAAPQSMLSLVTSPVYNLSTTAQSLYGAIVIFDSSGPICRSLHIPTVFPHSVPNGAATQALYCRVQYSKDPQHAPHARRPQGPLGAWTSCQSSRSAGSSSSTAHHRTAAAHLLLSMTQQQSISKVGLERHK